jgi:hypothetical protein
MTSKYPAWVLVLALATASCSPQTVVPTASPTVTATPSVSATPGLAAAVAVESAAMGRRWYLVPDGLAGDPELGSGPNATAAPVVTVRFAADPSAGRPVARLQPGGRETPLRAVQVDTGLANLDVTGLAPGQYTVEIVEHLAGGGEAVVGKAAFVLSQPEYVVWTLDFEGDASGDAELANTAAIADELKIPMSVFWNPRAWTSSQVSTERQDAMLAWTKGRMTKGDEVALHLHMWTDYVRAAGLVARTAPSWAGRGDGYDVPMTAYTEAEQRTLVDFGVKLMANHGLPKPTSFRAGGDIGDAATLRAVAAAGFTADCTAVAKDYPPIGRVPYPWSLPVGAQPYRPSSTDANATGDLPLLEAPTIGGNTYAFTASTIQPQIRANLGLFAAAGSLAAERTVITVVSHPGTIVAAERAAIEALLGAFGPLRYDTDTGPLRFVTLAQLAKAYRR